MMELQIILPQDFDERLLKFRKGLESSGVIPVRGALSWDSATCELVMGGKRVKVPPASNQSVICDALFDGRPQGQWLEDIDVRHNLYKDTKTAMYSAVRALNDTAKQGFGIEDLFEFTRDRARIRIENLAQNL